MRTLWSALEVLVKTSTARILARALNCSALTPKGNPCNECANCVSVINGTFMDLLEVDAASNRGIDQIRELKEKLEFSPVEGRHKVYIIDEVHMLTTEAFNALLKTLEEPPSHVVFILATTDVHKLPATILSRCQRYDFKLGSDEEISKVLEDTAAGEQVVLADGALKLLVQNAQGSYRDALSLLDVVVSGQVKSNDPYEVSENEVRRILGVPDSTMVYYLLEKLIENNPTDAVKMVDELSQKGVNLSKFVKFVLDTLREILLAQMSGKIKDTEFSFAYDISERTTLRLMSLFLDADAKMKNTSLPVLVLEMAIAQWCYGAESSGTSTVSQNIKPVPSGTNSTADTTGSVSKPAAQSSKTESRKAKKTGSGKKSIFKDGEPKEIVPEVESTPQVEITSVVDEKILPTEEQKDIDEEVDKGSHDGVLSVKDVEDGWEDVTTKVREFNAHLYAFMKSAHVESVESNTITLYVPFDFHKDRMEDPKSREALLGIFKEVYGCKVQYRCEVSEAVQRKKPSNAESVLNQIKQAAQVSAAIAEKQVKEAEKKADAPKKKDLSDEEREERKKVKKVNKKIEKIFKDM